MTEPLDNTIIRIRELTKTFKQQTVINQLTVDLNGNDRIALIGQNGAGKSTLMKILYGLEHPTAGEIYIRGEKQVFKNPQDAMKSGIGMVQQNFMLLPPFTVAENIVYGKEPRKSRFLFDRKKAKAEVDELSER